MWTRARVRRPCPQAPWALTVPGPATLHLVLPQGTRWAARGGTPLGSPVGSRLAGQRACRQGRQGLNRRLIEASREGPWEATGCSGRSPTLSSGSAWTFPSTERPVGGRAGGWGLTEGLQPSLGRPPKGVEGEAAENPQLPKGRSAASFPRTLLCGCAPGRC